MATFAEIFRRHPLYQEGHFLLSSGMHSPTYIQIALLLQHPAETAEACRELADRFRDRGVEVVVGPAIGAIVLAYEVARQLGARALWTEREEGRMALRRSFAVRPGERALVVEDVVTTGAAVGEVKRLLEAHGARVVGVGALVDRSNTALTLGVPFEALVTVEAEAYLPALCPLCREGLPLTKPGSRTHAPPPP